MKLSPLEFTGRALTIVENVGRARLQMLGRSVGKAQVPDVHALLGYLLDNLESLFPLDTPRRDARSYVHEFRSIRNKWAHSEPLEYDDAYRAADTAQRLLKLLGCDEPSIEALKREVRAVQAQDSIYQAGPAAPRPADGNFARVAVIACGKLKQSQAAPAIELYTGPIFRGCVDVAKSEGLPIVVLNTRYGLVDPTDVLEPYELSYQAMTPPERQRLTDLLRSQFTAFLDAGLTQVLVLGGQDYLYLVGASLRERPVKVEHHPRWKEVRKRVYG